MSLYKKIENREEKIAVVGLGYVGLPIALSFAKKATVIGFDISKKKIDAYLKGLDLTGECCEEVKETTVYFTDDENVLSEASFIIIAVPTPVNGEHIPDLAPIIEASRIVGRNIKKGSYVVYESTVYPGCTESVCIPILEKESNLNCGSDFKVGYSPERINPGDKIHKIDNITKIVAGIDDESTGEISRIYELAITAGTYKVSTIKTAEAIKIAENSQRDINIAFMNELAKVFDMMEIDTNEVICGMNTKWNALGFKPGLVGGHCIGVDPYYFIYKAKELGYHSELIQEGRRINESMPDFIVQKTIGLLRENNYNLSEVKIAVLGITFKENCNDIRNSKVIDIIKRIKEFGINTVVADPFADSEEVFQTYGISMTDTSEIEDVDCVILAVAHDYFRECGIKAIKNMFSSDSCKKKIIMDVKGIIKSNELVDSDYICWRL